ncbi:hypothetical protein HanIR_Chr11g0511321 [Helianthus annuus]|nr:hypothetical protein HanIR_Chr11g0511321 [Helianthus annuus]
MIGHRVIKSVDPHEKALASFWLLRGVEITRDLLEFCTPVCIFLLIENFKSHIFVPHIHAYVELQVGPMAFFPLMPVMALAEAKDSTPFGGGGVV